MINFLKSIYKDIFDKLKYNDEFKDLYNYISGDNIYNVNSPKIKDLIFKLFQKHIENVIKLKDINKNIIANFDYLFNVDNITKLLSNTTKIKLRNQIYYLIELSKNNIDNIDNINKLIYFILDYLNLTLLKSEDNINKIIDKIKLNIQKFINKGKINYLYPITFFDDMSSGIDDFIYFNNQIINLDKSKIDGAKIKGSDKYLTKKQSTNIFIKSDLEEGKESIGFTVNSNIKIKYVNFKYYLENLDDDFNIVSEFYNKKFYNKKLIFRFKNNDISTILNVVKEISNIIQNLENIASLTYSFIENFSINTNYKKLFGNENNIKLYLTNILILIQASIEKKYIEGFIITILFGLKRFGDWIQLKISKKYYFIVQTKDFYSLMYGLLIKAPVIIENKLYNYNPPSKFLTDLTYGIESIKIFDKNDIRDIQDEKIIFKGLRDINVDINRLYLDKYLHKYLKYKKKYLILKKLQSS
jgi:hypothetical protein